MKKRPATKLTGNRPLLLISLKIIRNCNQKGFATHLIIPPPIVEVPVPLIIPPRNVADILRKGCPALIIGMLDKEVVIVPIRFDIPDCEFGPLTEEMLLKIVPIMPR